MDPIDIVWIRLNTDPIIGAELRFPFRVKRSKHLGRLRKEVSDRIIAAINSNNGRNLLQGINDDWELFSILVLSYLASWLPLRVA
jgi:hypothetical protein